MANAGVLGSIMPTRSPGSTPACSSSVATREAAASNSAKVNCRSSQRSATRLGLRSFDATRLVLRLVMVYLRDRLEVPGSLGSSCPVFNRASADFAEAMSAGTRSWPVRCDGTQLIADWSPTGGWYTPWLAHRRAQLPLFVGRPIFLVVLPFRPTSRSLYESTPPRADIGKAVGY